MYIYMHNYSNNLYYNSIIEYLSKKHKIKITKIGTITNRDVKYYDHNEEIKINLKGVDHFSS